MGSTAKQPPFSNPVFAATTNVASNLTGDAGYMYMFGLRAKKKTRVRERERERESEMDQQFDCNDRGSIGWMKGLFAKAE